MHIHGIDIEQYLNNCKTGVCHEDDDTPTFQNFIESTHASNSDLTQVAQEIGKFGTAVSETDVMNISYQDSNMVQINITQGYVLKALVDADMQTVYIEKKCDDGTSTGYNVDMQALSKASKNPIEQIAEKAWKQASSDSKLSFDDDEMDTKYQQAMDTFCENIIKKKET